MLSNNPMLKRFCVLVDLRDCTSILAFPMIADFTARNCIFHIICGLVFPFTEIRAIIVDYNGLLKCFTQSQ